jgi:hypothetical protein
LKAQGNISLSPVEITTEFKPGLKVKNAGAYLVCSALRNGKISKRTWKLDTITLFNRETGELRIKNMRRAYLKNPYLPGKCRECSDARCSLSIRVRVKDRQFPAAMISIDLLKDSGIIVEGENVRNITRELSVYTQGLRVFSRIQADPNPSVTEYLILKILANGRTFTEREIGRRVIPKK